MQSDHLSVSHLLFALRFDALPCAPVEASPTSPSMPRWSAQSKAFAQFCPPLFIMFRAAVCVVFICSLIPFYISVTAAHLPFRSPLPLFHQHHPATQCREKPRSYLLLDSDSYPTQYLSAMAFSSHEDEDDGQDEVREPKNTHTPIHIHRHNTRRSKQ